MWNKIQKTLSATKVIKINNPNPHFELRIQILGPNIVQKWADSVFGFGSPNLVFLQRGSFSLYLFLDGNAEFGILIDDVDENNVIIVGFDRQDPEQVGK